MTPDVLVAGGGIAGSAVAILLGRAGLRVELFERGEFPREKPCGEGLMPAGVAVLERLGLAGSIGGARFHGVRYHFDAQVATGRFPSGHGMPTEGLAQRRAVLDQALFEAAATTPGVRAHTQAQVVAPVREDRRVTGLVVNGVVRRAGLVIAADGARSRLRSALGLDLPQRRRRFGMRAHFRLAPGAAAPPWVDIFLGADHELYVAALPRGELVVAALAEVRHARAPAEAIFERWWRAHPRLSQRLRGARRLTPLRGALPLSLRARRGYVPGMVLLGDAAGSLDPIAGCGMTQALVGAELLAGYAMRGVTGSDDWLAEFERARRSRFLDTTLLTQGLLWLSRHPGCVPPALAALRAWPGLFSHLVGVAGGARTLSGFGNRASLRSV
jgi:2-polyprenyl-6-methoxyphenol hydroxylase-like FAD-dependent oxidoreductase